MWKSADSTRRKESQGSCKRKAMKAKKEAEKEKKAAENETNQRREHRRSRVHRISCGLLKMNCFHVFGGFCWPSLAFGGFCWLFLASVGNLQVWRAAAGTLLLQVASLQSCVWPWLTARFSMPRALAQCSTHDP